MHPEATTPILDRALLAVRGKSLSAARTSRIDISRLMRFAARHAAIVVKPLLEVDRIEGRPKRRPLALTKQERRAWLDALNDDPYAQAWDLPDVTKLMPATGCRIGEEHDSGPLPRTAADGPGDDRRLGADHRHAWA